MSVFSSFWDNITGKTAADASTQQAQAMQNKIDAREQQRQADIQSGKGSIDSAFAQFTPDYYNKYRDTYVGAYQPEIKNQYDRALGQLTASLAGRDVLEGTPGADALGQLQKARSDTEANIGNAATDASNSLRANVEGTKSNLYGLNLSASDPQMMASRAGSAAASLASPAANPKLGDIFSGALTPFNTASKVDASSLQPQYPWNQANTKLASGNGSGIFT